jgi:hypothetical protein
MVAANFAEAIPATTAERTGFHGSSYALVILCVHGAGLDGQWDAIVGLY